MTVLRTSSGNGNNNTRWIEFDSIKTIQCVISNIYCEITKRSLPITFALNLPLRVWSCISGIKDKQYTKVVHDVLVLSFLLLPHGRYIAVAVDMTSKLIDLYPEKFDEFPHRSEEKDYSIYENAIDLLGLSMEEAQNEKTVKACYNRRLEECTKRIKKLQDSGHDIVAKKVEKILNDVNIAYQTVRANLKD